MVTPRALVREAVHPAARVHRRMLLNTVCRGSLVFRLPGVQDQDILVPPLGGSRRAGRVIAESRHHVPLPVAAALDDAETVRPKSKPFPRGGGAFRPEPSVAPGSAAPGDAVARSSASAAQAKAGSRVDAVPTRVPRGGVRPGSACRLWLISSLPGVCPVRPPPLAIVRVLLL